MRRGLLAVQQGRIILLIGKMDAPQGFMQRQKTVLALNVRGQIFGNGRRKLIHHAFHDFAHLFLIQAFGQRIDRHDAPGVQQFHVRVEIAENFVFRLDHFHAAVGGHGDFAAQHDMHVRFEDFLQIGLTEPLGRQHARLIPDHQLEELLFLARRGRDVAHADHTIDGFQGFAGPQFDDFFDMAAVFIASGEQK